VRENSAVEHNPKAYHAPERERAVRENSAVEHDPSGYHAPERERESYEREQCSSCNG
jgi:hypothetical protein